MYELESAISTLKPTNSAGIDQLSSSLILATHLCYDHTLLEILNVSLSNGWFPSPWKIAKITIIQKPNKSNYELLENYRPISVLPTFSKIFERIILSRLKWIAAEGRWFNPGQHGFREGCSTETAAHDLVHHIETHLSNKEFTASAFVDIKAAFDSAWHPAIIAALLKKNCPLYLVRIIGDYLANGKPQIDIDGHLIETDISTGCPQGGILSAFLWITLIDDVFNIFLPFPVFISAYADDLNIACSHSDPTLATYRLNIACNAVVDWLFSIKLRINPPKTIFMIFDFRRSNRLLPANLSLTLQGTAIFPSTSTTFLGFHIDNILCWKKHIDLKCTSATRLFYSMRHCLSLTWGLNRARLLTLYKLIIEPTILYGCSIWAKRATLKSTKKILRGAQRRYAIQMLRTFRTTHTESLLIMSGIMPLDYRVLELTTIRYLELKDNKNFSKSAAMIASKAISATKLNIPYDRAKCIHLPEIPPWQRNHPQEIQSASSKTLTSADPSTTRIFTDGSIHKNGAGFSVLICFTS
jgi:hypothetical protein